MGYKMVAMAKKGFLRPKWIIAISSALLVLILCADVQAARQSELCQPVENQ